MCVLTVNLQCDDLTRVLQAIIFYPSLKQLEENAGLEASLGLGCTAVGISVSCLFLGCFVSYSRAVKAQVSHLRLLRLYADRTLYQLNWPAHDPHPDPVKSQQNALPPGPAPGGMGDPMGGMDGMGAPPPGDPGMDPMGMGGMPRSPFHFYFAFLSDLCFSSYARKSDGRPWRCSWCSSTILSLADWPWNIMKPVGNLFFDEILPDRFDGPKATSHARTT